MIVLVIGREGQVAKSLSVISPPPGMRVVCMGRPMLDLREPASIVEVLEATNPDAVINAGAYTAVDQAESEPDLAFAVNADGPTHVAAACTEQNIPVIHLSTDYVFSGDKSSLYAEADPVGPGNVYGASKLAGEQRLASANPRHIILRTAWVHSPFGQNFVKTMLRLGVSRPQINVVDDQRGNPTYAIHLAEAILAIANQIRGAAATDSRFGVYHAVNGGETTWFGFASEVFRQARAFGYSAPALRPITTAEFPTAASRPANSCLDPSKLMKTFRVALPSWQEGVRDCLKQLADSTNGTFEWWLEGKSAAPKSSGTLEHLSQRR